MKLNELFKPDNGLFQTVFYAEFPEQYGTIFGSTAPEKLDLLTYTNYGNRTLLNSITAENYADIVSAIISIGVTNWVKQAKAMTAEYEVLAPPTFELTRTESRSTDQTESNESINSKKVYNDQNFNDDQKQQDNASNNRQEEITISEQQKGIGNSREVSDTIKKEFELRMINWQKNIIFAIINEITVNIYE